VPRLMHTTKSRNDAETFTGSQGEVRYFKGLPHPEEPPQAASRRGRLLRTSGPSRRVLSRKAAFFRSLLNRTAMALSRPHEDRHHQIGCAVVEPARLRGGPRRHGAQRPRRRPVRCDVASSSTPPGSKQKDNTTRKRCPTGHHPERLLLHMAERVEPAHMQWSERQDYHKGPK